MIKIEYICPNCSGKSKMEVLNILSLIEIMGAYTCNYCNKVAFNRYDYDALMHLVRYDSDPCYHFLLEEKDERRKLVMYFKADDRKFRNFDLHKMYVDLIDNCNDEITLEDMLKYRNDEVDRVGKSRRKK